MSLSIKDVEFNIGTGAVATTVAVTGVGFQPKVVFFFAIGRTDAVDAGAAGSPNRLIGWAAATTEGGGTKQQCVATDAENAVASGSAGSGNQNRTDACILALQVGSQGLIDGQAHLSSFDADGFTLTIDDQFSINQRVLALCVGGTDPARIEMGSLSSPSTGAVPFTQDVAVGFDVSDGQGILVLAGVDNGTDNDNDQDSGYCLGFATSVTQQACLGGGRAHHNTSITQAIRFLTTSAVFQTPNGAMTSLVHRAAFNGWITGGFQLNWLQVNSLAHRLHWLVIKGGDWAVLQGLTATSLTTVPLTGAGFAPKGGLVLSAMGPLNTTCQSCWLDNDASSIGVFTGATSRRVVAQSDLTAQATSSAGMRIEHDEVYLSIDAAGAVVGLMDVQSLDSDGVTFVMDDADSAANAFVAVLAGSPSAGGGTSHGGPARRRRRRQ